MRVIVTGACGFVGGYLSRALLQEGHTVLGVVQTLPREGTSLPEGYSYQRVDIRELAALKSIVAEFQPDVIYHLAGVSFVPHAEADFSKALSVNVGGVENLIEAARSINPCPKLIFASSAEVFGKIYGEELPITESSPVRPANRYSLTKAMAELALERAHREFKLPVVIMRPFNHIGPGQADNFVASTFARQLARIALGYSEPVVRVGNLDARRDFSDVRDIIRAYQYAAVKGDGLYVLGAGRSVRVGEILERLIKLSNVSVEVQFDPARMRPPEVPEVYGDCSKAAKELAWQPEIPLEQTLKDIYDEWYQIEKATKELLG